MSDNDPKLAPKLPGDANRLVDLGACDNGARHVIAMRDDVPVAATHMWAVEEGKPLPNHGAVYWVDNETGTVVDSMRLGNGPPQVATPAYRNNWDTIFGHKSDLSN